MKLSIIITHHLTSKLLDLCINSINKTIGGLKHEIIVVNSESKEKDEEFIKDKWQEIEIISFKKNTGYSKLVNTGIKKATGDFILLLNADIIVLENTILEMINYLEEHENVGIVAPKLEDYIGNLQISCFSDPIPSIILARRTFWGKTKKGKKLLEKISVLHDNNLAKEVDWVQGSAMMFKKDIIDKVGFWDERFFMYFEDSDWCRRVRKKGYKVIYLPTAKMVHYYHRSSKKFGVLGDLIFNKYARIHILSAIKYFKKYGFK
ncbi:MAG TPA: glycosyltransferase family 2 protein [Candidatus Portnoybacteria bacterium]|jgi:GT2 family glycosyltransferase|nr:glycosyltransferase family 2 protein [Candidatus Portnoybacteria bacterium]MDD5752202.1 glycosyltransferase family 2 protein [Candidatus Portnoybacteria bacterium]HNU96929.1 glycosyltransferase family 2 protein [Candidatus Portnoybacteria bacterium]HOZ16568.1 glycosyltransferase family 2 protein [Candidatus Portnoybacteria bacterium]HPH52195.1 glycosyltransferase family 2 protein [Candidatus Portnoybacteria bacterium]